jgi:hypothetical protein
MDLRRTVCMKTEGYGRRSSFLVSTRTTNTFNNNHENSAPITPTHCRIYTKINIIRYYKPSTYIMHINLITKIL